MIVPLGESMKRGVSSGRTSAFDTLEHISLAHRRDQTGRYRRGSRRSSSNPLNFVPEHASEVRGRRFLRRRSRMVAFDLGGRVAVKGFPIERNGVFKLWVIE